MARVCSCGKWKPVLTRKAWGRFTEAEKLTCRRGALRLSIQIMRLRSGYPETALELWRYTGSEPIGYGAFPSRIRRRDQARRFAKSELCAMLRGKDGA